MVKETLPAVKWDMPPIEKIHEALSAVVDERIEMFNDYALVSSSDYKKKYTIKWNNNIYTSNDNASYWQGYIGYPVIAVLMIQGKIKYDKDISIYFKGINWKELNTKCKNKYSKVVAIILEELKNEGIDTEKINNSINNIYEQLPNLDILYSRSKLLPPK